MDKAIDSGYIIEWGWCAFIENRVRRRGLKTLMDEPYFDCAGLMAEYCQTLYKRKEFCFTGGKSE